jgi:hypothetical protein
MKNFNQILTNKLDNLDEQKIKNIDFKPLVKGVDVIINGVNVSTWGEYLNSDLGVNPYKLYAFLSTIFDNSIILDVGSQYGSSALSLSYNQTNQVISYDIVDCGTSAIIKSNIIWKVMDFRHDSSINFDEVKMIVIDVDPHDGVQEREMIKFLEDKKWSGILILDDIYKDNQMKDFWNSIEKENKLDFTNIGHITGTGVIIF